MSKEKPTDAIARQLMAHLEEYAEVLDSLMTTHQLETKFNFFDGLSLQELRLLRLLKSRGKLKMSEVAHHVRLATSSVTSLVDRLERLKLVQRDRCDQDRRVVHVSLSKMGDEFGQCVEDGKQKLFMYSLSGMSQQEAEEYLRLSKLGLTNIKHAFGL